MFREVSWTPSQGIDETIQEIETFVCSLYYTQSRFCATDINKLRYNLFSKLSANNLRKLPPTKDALHVRGAAYVAGWIWGATLNKGIAISSPTQRDWKYNKDLQLIPQ